MSVGVNMMILQNKNRPEEEKTSIRSSKRRVKKKVKKYSVRECTEVSIPRCKNQVEWTNNIKNKIEQAR